MNTVLGNSFVRSVFFVRSVVSIRSVALAAVSCYALFGLSPSAASAEEQLTEITWAHPAPQRVSGFVVMISPTGSTSSDTRWVEVGKPTGRSSGTMSFYTAIIPISSDEYVAIGAVGINGLMSAMSPWSAVPPSRPGQPLVIEP